MIKGSVTTGRVDPDDPAGPDDPDDRPVWDAARVVNLIGFGRDIVMEGKFLKFLDVRQCIFDDLFEAVCITNVLNTRAGSAFVPIPRDVIDPVRKAVDIRFVSACARGVVRKITSVDATGRRRSCIVDETYENVCTQLVLAYIELPVHRVEELDFVAVETRCILRRVVQRRVSEDIEFTFGIAVEWE